MTGLGICITALMCAGFLANYGICMEDMGTDMDDLSLPKFGYERTPKDNAVKKDPMNGENNGEGNSMPDDDKQMGFSQLMKATAGAESRKTEQVKVVANPVNEEITDIPTSIEKSSEKMKSEEDPVDAEVQIDEVPEKAASESVAKEENPDDMPRLGEESSDTGSYEPAETEPVEASKETASEGPEESEDPIEPTKESIKMGDEDAAAPVVETEDDMSISVEEEGDGPEEEESEDDTKPMRNGEDNDGTGRYGVGNGQGNQMMPIDTMEEFMANLMKEIEEMEMEMKEKKNLDNRIMGSHEDFLKNMDSELKFNLDDDMGPKDDFLSDMDAKFDDDMDLDLDLDLDFDFDF